jgi:hypothetical protein
LRPLACCRSQRNRDFSYLGLAIAADIANNSEAMAKKRVKKSSEVIAPRRRRRESTPKPGIVFQRYAEGWRLTFAEFVRDEGRYQRLLDVLKLGASLKTASFQVGLNPSVSAQWIEKGKRNIPRYAKFYADVCHSMSQVALLCEANIAEKQPEKYLQGPYSSTTTPHEDSQPSEDTPVLQQSQLQSLGQVLGELMKAGLLNTIIQQATPVPTVTIEHSVKTPAP